PTRSTPYVVIAIAAVLAIALVIPEDLEFLVGIYAFGALLAFTIAHVSVVRSRFLEPERRRPYVMPLNVQVGGVSVPLPGVVGGVVSFAAWVSVLVLHSGARYVGLGWMAAGLTLYLLYRTTQDKSVTKRVTVPEAALREDPREAEYGSILVPIFGNSLDDDIIQTAGRLAAEEPSRIRGGALLGGRTPLDNFVGDITKYVVQKAPCRVILTAPPAADGTGGGEGGEVR